MFEAVVAQADMLRSRGAVPVVLGVEDEAAAQDAWRLEGVERHLAPPRGPATLAYAPGLRGLLGAAKLDLLHLHGIWQYPVKAAGDWARRTGKLLVVSPHGMLDPWITSRNAWKKHLARLLWEDAALNQASLFHALTQSEAADIERQQPATPRVVIPNAAPDAAAAPLSPRGPVALYLGRIHEKKNLGALIAGWLEAHDRLPADASLIIAGWGDEDGIAALEQALPQANAAGVEFVGTAFGSQKAALFDLARFLVLPSHSEGLPMAILEGWSAGVPSLMSANCNLPEGFTTGAALDCGTSTESIASTLVEGFALAGDDWKAMSRAAQDLACGVFSREAVASRWEDAYAGLL
ncbi:glycosyltransferase [Qipengyuania intermedia]|uniref:glycosyltransferase n=1 Tax=Qipengyuania intermedia TaxID=2867244 RepID=UPI0031E66637